MEQITGLYKIMLLLSAVVMLMGFVLNLGKIGRHPSYIKMLLILAAVNIISIADYLLNFKPSPDSDLSIPLVFLNSIILILNLIIANFIYKCHHDLNVKYEKQIINLFIYSFLSECVLIFLVYFFKSDNSFFNIENDGFPYIFGFISLLMIFGTLVPGVKSIRKLILKIPEKRFLFLIVLNMFNNLIGLYFYSLKIPSKEIGIILNMFANLVFAYYFGYYLLSEYFSLKKIANVADSKPQGQTYSWLELKNHLSHWSETRSYLIQCYPEMVTEVEKYQLSDLEKIHLILKLLNVKAKEVAHVLNISVRAVEMQRYRIGKKINISSAK